LPVVSAVGTAHERGIVHRDLKPSNIFLDARPGEGRPLVKVLDFGIAKWLLGDPGDGGLRTRTGSTLGTPSYMAPEQATGDRNADHRADIWSLGVILYEALSGVRPLEGDNAAQLVMRLLSTGIMPIEQLVPELPPELAELVGRMLSRDVTRRPVDLREVYRILCTLSGEVSVAFGPPPWRSDAGASRADAELEGVVAVKQSGGSVRIAARGHVATQRSPQALATHTAIEVNSLPISGAPPASERGHRPRGSLYVALIGGAVALIYGGLFWLGRGDATLASPGPRALGAGGASVESAASSVPASLLAAPATETRAAQSAGSTAVGAAGAGPLVQATPAARPHDPGKPRLASGEQGRAGATGKHSAAARRVPAARDRAQGAALPVRNAEQRAVGATPARAHAATPARSSHAAQPPPAASQTAAGAPPGAACESSDECQSRLCAAYSCQ
ncbi:MAG TPA: protein kinase, partial [Polyangiaceae bacterium]|nr:protein kinase [Polyangiaceae bacterium]